MRISDWSSDVCSSDLDGLLLPELRRFAARVERQVDEIGYAFCQRRRAANQADNIGFDIEAAVPCGEAGGAFGLDPGAVFYLRPDDDRSRAGQVGEVRIAIGTLRPGRGGSVTLHRANGRVSTA